MTAFWVFITICFWTIFAALIAGIKMNYGKHFGRKIFVYDANAKNHTKEIFNDGTYVIKNGKVTGRINLTEAEKRDDHQKYQSVEP